MIYEKYKDDDFLFAYQSVSTNSNYKPMEKHYHNLFEIYFIDSGTCVYFINNSTYHLQTGDIILVPPGVIHNTRYYVSKHSRYLVYCPVHYIPSSVRPMLHKMLHLYRNPSISDQIIDLFNKMRLESSQNDAMHKEIMLCYTRMLFFLMARNLDSCIQVSGECAYIENAITYIQENFANNISLVELADKCSVTPVHFSRMFKKETGFGFNNYLNLLRLQKAESILSQSPKKSVTEIASMCGFSDSNYFSTKFKQLYGMSPKQFQKKES